MIPPTVAALLLFVAADGALAAENKTGLGTAAATGVTTGQSGGAVIGTDPATGTRVMRTPEPKQQQEYQGPQTVIVAPEVYPDRPGKPQGRPPHRPRSGK